MYVKQRCPKPKFSEEAKVMLNQYYVNVRVSYGSQRILNTIYAIAANIARIKLKHIVDAADARETMQFYNIILQQWNKMLTFKDHSVDDNQSNLLQLQINDSILFPVNFLATSSAP